MKFRRLPPLPFLLILAGLILLPAACSLPAGRAISAPTALPAEVDDINASRATIAAQLTAIATGDPFAGDSAAATHAALATLTAGAAAPAAYPPAYPPGDPAAVPAAYPAGEALPTPAEADQPPTDDAAAASLTPTDQPLPATSTPLPTRTPLPSDTPPPSPTLPPTPTPTATPPPFRVSSAAAGLGAPTWSEGFDGDYAWPYYNNEYLAMRLGDGRLDMTALTASRRDPRDNWMISQESYTNFYLEISVTPSECASLDRFGVIFRAAADAAQGYLFSIACDGRYALKAWSGGRTYMLLPWTAHPAIRLRPAQPLLLGVRAEGSRLTVYLDGQRLAGVDDDTFSSGAVGPAVGAMETAGFTAAFDQLLLWALP
ncbi:MAG: hypothetical protein ACKOC5_09880 [Chloroflexota bacterium]